MAYPVHSKSLSTYTLLEIIDRAFRMYRDNFLTFFGLAAIVIIPLTVINLVVSQSFLDQLLLASGSFFLQQEALNNYVLAASVLAVITGILQTVFVNGLLTHMVSENHLGRRVGIIETFYATRDRLMSLGMGLFVFYLLMFLVGFVSALTVGCVVGIVGFGLMIYLGVAISAFLAPVSILERVSVSQAVNRAWALGKARFWSLFGLIALIAILTSIVSLGLGVIQQLFTQPAAATNGQDGGIVDLIFQLAITIVVAPILPIGVTLMYYDTRVRLEGLDIAFQAVEKPDVRPSDVVSPPVNSSLNNQDFLNIAVIVGGVVVLFLVLGVAGNMLLNVLMPGLPVP